MLRGESAGIGAELEPAHAPAPAASGRPAQPSAPPRCHGRTRLAFQSMRRSHPVTKWARLVPATVPVGLDPHGNFAGTRPTAGRGAPRTTKTLTAHGR